MADALGTIAPARPRVAFNTLGCKLNQYETDAIASRFIDNGYEVVPFDQEAEAYIINSCTVTNKADRKSRNTLNRAHRYAQRPGDDQAVVVVTGCFVESHRDELEKDGRSFVVDNDRKNHIFELVDAWLKGEILHPESFPAERFAYDRSQQVFRTRGMVKIQDGCDNFCSFCIIPFVRGKGISRPPQDIFQSAKQMLDEGYRELVLTGVNMSRYKHEDTRFSHIVEGLLELEGDFRVRISSIEPDQIDENFIQLMAHPKMTPHLHLCLQSGSEKMLLQMRRQYTYVEYRDIVENIRRSIPDFNITTDLIVGFPGESEDEFLASLNAVREIGFGHVHAFKYSVREGTRAQRMSEQVKESDKSRRSEALRLAAEEEKRRFRRRFVGREQNVLIERVSQSGNDAAWIARGLGEHYLPVRFSLSRQMEAAGRSPKDLTNQYARVRIVSLDDGEDPELVGEMLA